MTIKWKIVSNDNDTVVLRQETEEGFEEAELHRPSNVDVEAWLAMYVVGAEFGTKELHERTKFESARRKGAGVLTASQAWTVERWNRPAPIRKQCEDLLEQMRTYLAGVDTVSMLEYARLLYVKHSATNPDIAQEYVAIASSEDVCSFIDRYDNPVAPLSLAELEEAFKMGLVTAEHADELKQAMKDKKEGQC